MYICICAAVTDSDIKDEISQGACCMQDLKERLGVASCCGQCEPAAETLIKENLYVSKSSYYQAECVIKTDS